MVKRRERFFYFIRFLLIKNVISINAQISHNIFYILLQA